MEKTNDDAIAKFHQRKRKIRKIVLFLIAFIFIAIYSIQFLYYCTQFSEKSQ